MLLPLAVLSKCISIYFLVYVCALRHYIIHMLIFRSILKGACSCDSQWGVEGGVTRKVRTMGSYKTRNGTERNQLGRALLKFY